MTRGLEKAACTLCAAAKRRCDRQSPECSRCKRAHRRCYYAPSRSGAFAWVELNDNQSISTSARADTPGSGYYSNYAQPQSGTSIAEGSEFPDLPDEVLTSLREPQWFTTPDTWKSYHYAPAERNDFPVGDIKQYISYIRGWLDDWIRTGSNQFVHPRLYRARFPRPMQRAFTAMSSYVNRTPETESFILRVIDNDAIDLINASEPGIEPLPIQHDALEQLARVQALLVYQYIGLYDGDIRLRHQAEQRIPTLKRWCEQMVERAKTTLCLGSLLVWPDPEQALNGIALTDVSNLDDLQWYTWIHAECVRRTWLVVSGLLSLYELRRDGFTDCMGGMMFTTRKGVWDARSAVTWEKLCSRVNVGMIAMDQGEQIMRDNAPGELDGFANVVLEITFGTERIERWRAEKG